MSPLKFEADVLRTNSAAVVSARGRITLGEASQALRGTIEQLCTEGTPNIVLNLSGVTFIDSAGLGVLTLGYSKTKAAGGMLKIAQPQARVKDAMEMTRLTRMFPLYTSTDEAVASFTNAEPLVKQETAAPAQ
jgi:anti-sigma B factor antagonist